MSARRSGHARPAPSPELVERVKKLRHAGDSYALIGDACGITKGAVAGILWRAGECVVSATRTPARTLKRRRRAEVPKPAKPEPVRLPVPVLPARLLPPGLSCAWPLWTEATPRALRTSCGEPVAIGSYCRLHHAIAYVVARHPVVVPSYV